MNHLGHFKKHRHILSIVLQCLDLFLVVSFLHISYYGYYSTFTILPSHYLITASLGGILTYFYHSNAGIYQSWRSQKLLDQALQILKVWFMIAMTLVVIAWGLKASENFSRIIIGSWLLLSPIAMILSRIIIRGILIQARNKGHNSRNIAIAGTGKAALELIAQIKENTWMGYRIAGIYQNIDCPSEHGIDASLIKGDLEQLAIDAQTQQYDAVYIALPMSAEQAMSDLINRLSNCSIPVHIIPDLFTFQLLNARISSIGNLPLLNIYDTPHDGTDKLLKRAEDITIAGLILLLISPVMLAIAIAIKLTSKGPIIFKQKRYGIGGKSINVFKFRSMTAQDDGKIIVQASKGDSRITPLGAFLRKTSLDELPQFVNVLRGCMSIVGPRPHAIAHNEMYRKDIQGYMLRHLVKPGITGWAQINGWRGETDTLDKMEKRIEFDLYYIRNWSIFFDLRIIFLTIIKGFVNKNAY